MQNKTKENFISFSGRTCLVTGAGSPDGIGFETAKLLGLLGGRVLLVSTTERIAGRARELQEFGIEAEGMTADLMDRGQVTAIVQSAVANYGSIDVLINNAGMTQVGQPEDFSLFAEMTPESWDQDIARNLTLCFNVTHAVLPHMQKQNYGRIVNTSSVTGPLVSNPGEAGYSAAKAGIVGMSRAIAIESAQNNVTINCVLPGWIATASQTESEAAAGQITPAGRSGTPEEVANLIVFLASGRASYITGQTFVVDGGNTIQEYKGPRELYY
jgi:3-oxoacyl-[acyl-carrier protein] reductase